MALIECVSVSKAFGGRAAVRDFSLAAEAGESIVILGPSGCGKTTVLRMLAGLTVPDAGRIALDGATVAEAGRLVVEPEDRPIGMVFQDLALWPHLTVRGNLEFGLRARGVPREERDRRIDAMLALLEMTAHAGARPGALSGGQQQRVALGRALVLRPKVLLMDEPLSSLDEELRVRLRREIRELRQRLGFTLVYVTHDREEARELATRIVVMIAEIR